MTNRTPNASVDPSFLISFGFILLGLGVFALITIWFVRKRQRPQNSLSKILDNEILRVTLEKLDDGVIIFDLKGQIIFSNSALLKIMQTQSIQNECQYFNFPAIFYNLETKQQIPKEALPFALVLFGDLASEIDMIVRFANSPTESIVNCQAKVILDSNGTKVAVVAYFRDLTTIKRAEEIFQTAQISANEIARQKSEVLAQISEELRLPFLKIQQLAKLIEDTPFDKQQKSLAKSLSLSIVYFANKIQVYSDQSSFEKGTLKLNPVPFKLNESLQHIISILRPMALERQVELLFESEIENDFEIISDRKKIEEILISSIEEVVLQSDKGFVSLKVKALEVFEGKARFYFEIKSSSPTLVETKREKRYFRSPLIKEMIRLLDGEVNTEINEQDKSSRYSLTFDLKLKRQDERNIVKQHTQISSEKPILVAEDQYINQMLIRKYLERFGLSCHIVSDGRAAFLEATTGKYALVLMDCKMGPIDGYEATQLIRTHEKKLNFRIPIIAITANGSADDRKYCEQVGMDDYILKPIDLSNFELLLQKWLPPVLKEESIKKLDGYQIEGRPLFQVLAEEYFKSTPVLINKLEKAIDDQNLKQVQYFSHALKSASVTIGLDELGSLFEKLEYVLELQPGAKSVLTQIKDSYKKCEPILKNRMQL